MEEQQRDDNELQKELQYLKKKLTELSGESIKYDYQLSSMRFELKQRKDAFSTLTALQKKFTVATPLNELFRETVKAVITQLQMDRSVLLLYDAAKNSFTPVQWYGYLPVHVSSIIHEVKIPDKYLHEGEFMLVNKSVTPDELAIRIQRDFLVNFFIGVPVLFDDKPVAFLIASRLFEKVPFNQPLNKGDADTLMAIASLVASVLQNKNVAELREEMQKQKEENELVNRMLAELRATQAQLIQSEKMASLGELTAGIAHEIQNPLNFVNNFAEVNLELLDELKNAIEKKDATALKEVLQDLSVNLEKINHHGKRADSIVKSMLQHSGSSTGTKEPVDLNELLDEYLRLSFHGMRARDKTFNAKFEIHTDTEVKEISIVRQDIGRVILNLLANAFYAVHEKKTAVGSNYEPMVTVTTKRSGNEILVSIKDNGNGIPASVLDKVLQPFFTTKPTGQGTGLGLSLSYDIIKAHGGDMKIESVEGSYTEVVITLPSG